MPILAEADHVLSCPGLPEEGLVEAMAVEAAAVVVACRVRARLSWEPPRLPRQARAAACHAPHWPTEVPLQKYVSGVPLMTSARNWPGPGMAGVNEAFTGAPTAQLAGSELSVTCPAAPPLATVVSTKSTVPRGALASEQLGHFVRSA